MVSCLKLLHTLAVISSLLVLAHSSPWDLMKYMRTCLANVTASGEDPKSDVPKILQYQLPSTHAGKCLLSCILVTVSMLTPDGNFNMALIETIVNKFDSAHFQQRKQAYNACSEEVEETNSTDLCEKGYMAAKCMKDHLGQPPRGQLSGRPKLV